MIGCKGRCILVYQWTHKRRVRGTNFKQRCQFCEFAINTNDVNCQCCGYKFRNYVKSQNTLSNKGLGGKDESL